MSRARRVGGSGWAGVHGSFVGLSKAGGAKKPGVRIGKKPKGKPVPSKIDLSTLPDNEQVQKAAKRVLAVQSDIETTTKRLRLLESQLATMMDELKVAQSLAMPVKPRRTSTKAIAKSDKSKPQPKKKVKPSAAEHISDKQARENYRNAAKEFEVVHRVGGAIVGKRIVERS